MTRPEHICELILSAAVSKRADEPAFIYPESKLTWKQMEKDIRAVAGGLLHIGIKEGDNIAVLLPNLPLHPILAFAAPMIGAAYVPIDPSRPMAQLVKLLQNPLPSAVFVLESQASELADELARQDMQLPVYPVDENGFIGGDKWPRDAKAYDASPLGDINSIAVRRHTSGVCQDCQLVSLSHDNLLSATNSVRKALQVLPTSVIFGTFAFYDYSGFLFQILLPSWSHCTLQTCRKWSTPEVAQLLNDTDITAYIGPATHFEKLLPELQDLAKHRKQGSSESEPETSETAPSDSEAASVHIDNSPETTVEPSVDSEEPSVGETSTEPSASLVAESSSATDSVHVPSPLRRLRFALCAGAHSDLQTLSHFANSLGCPVVTAYGAAQASGIISINPAHFDPSCPDSVGRVISGLEVSIRDDDANLLGPGETGEIWVRGPNVVGGYSNREFGTNGDGWFATSDLGRLDENHWLYLVSRKEDRIVRGGFPIYPVEVESIIDDHEGVRECAVVGRQDSRYGQEVVAFIVYESDQAPSDSDLREFCEGKLPQYKTPTVFKTINELPRSENRFILRRELRDSLHS